MSIKQLHNKQLPLIQQSWQANLKAIVLDFLSFSTSFFKYLLNKAVFSIRQTPIALLALISLINAVKARVTRSLIWSRGRLGRPVVHFSVLGLAGVVFTSGGAMQSSFVVPKPWQPDLVLGATDIIPQANAAKTEAPDYRGREEAIEYTVQTGDTLSSVGAQFNVTIDSLEFANNFSGPTYLKPGQKLIIPPMSGLLVKVASGDTVSALAKKYSVSPQAIVDINYLDEPFTLRVGQQVMIPGGKVPPKPVYLAPAPPIQNGLPLARADETVYSESYAYSYRGGEAKTVGTGDFAWPTDQRYITQYFNYYHTALDIGKDSDLYAADTGTVVRSGWWPNGFGNAVAIDHGNGFVTTYGHMSTLAVSVGDIVEKGQVIGHMGNTGRSFGQHVHFMIQKNGVAVNPLQFY